MIDQWMVFGALAAALVLFVWDRWRYDIVAIGILLFLAIAGVVPAREAFLGFGHPAVITVAAVLVISRGLMNAGVVDLVASIVSRVGDRSILQLTALVALVTLFSGFMNNVGALALLMPAAVRMARSGGVSPSLFLMPLAFGSLLGGMTTLIGTPPNIVIASFREASGEAPFRMFDFAPVGALLALLGGLFIVAVGWRLVPQRQDLSSRDKLFHIGDYLSEVRVGEESKAVGKYLHEIEAIRKGDVVVAALLRGKNRIMTPSVWERLSQGDILIVEAEAEDLKEFIDSAELELEGGKELDQGELSAGETTLMEAVAAPGSRLIGRTAVQLDLRWRFGVNVLAVARQGSRLARRLRDIRFRESDVILFQGPKSKWSEVLTHLGCWPLAERDLKIGQPRRLTLALLLFAGAIAASVLGWLPIELSLSAAGLAMILLRVLSIDEAYRSLELPILILLAAMMPVGEALDRTGGADRIAGWILGIAADAPLPITLAVVMIGTMALTNIINNVAAAVLMAPIGATLARGLDLSVDPFLMAVAIGSSAAFLTPIGHQANTLVMGPGGYRFGDYWRLGLPLSVLVVLASVPMLMWVWAP